MTAGVRDLDARARLAIGVWVALILFAIVLASRRLAGAFAGPAPVAAALAVALAVALLSLGACALLVLGGGRARTTRQAWWVGGVTLFAPACAGLALLPAGATGGMAGLVVLLVAMSVGVVLAGQLPEFVNINQSAPRMVPSILPQPANTEPHSMVPVLDERLAAFADSQSAEADDESDDVSQWLTRRVSEAGAEILEGSTTATFLAGQKQAMVHIPFCPPFTRIPEVSCEIVAGEGARAKLAFAHTYGARVEVRLDASPTAVQLVRVGFSAVASAPHADAA